MRKTQAPAEPREVVGTVFAIAGVVGLLYGLGSVASLVLARGSHLQVTGTVVQVEKSCRKGCSYRPVVEYTVGAERFGVVGRVGNGWPVFEVGETVDVLASKRDPREARIDHWTQTAFPMAMGAGLGAIFGGIGYFLLRRK